MTSALQLDFLDLRHFSAQHLRPLLDEEGEIWSRDLRWDYRSSAGLVLQYVDSHLLSGYVALDQGRVCGYIFCVYENEKAVIGDVFASRRQAGEEGATAIESELIERLIETLQSTPGLTRVEAQLLLHRHNVHREPFERAGFRLYPRLFLEKEILAGQHDLKGSADAEFPLGARYRPWLATDIDIAPQLITAAYAGHIDSQINDQYVSVAGAQRFLHNIVRFPGCGHFEESCSWALQVPGQQRLLGLLLCSRVSSSVGHITQICVLPELQHHGIGERLLQLCAASLGQAGCDAVSLTVTEENKAAISVYQHAGFRTRHNFDAMLWESRWR
jgi:ribosomal protein S18 acetylase RimI-like enzyme